MEFYNYVIIGGGIAGVVCVETLCELIQPGRFGGSSARTDDRGSLEKARVALISATKTVKTTINLKRITNLIESFQISEKSGDIWSEAWPGVVHVLYDTVNKICPLDRLIYLSNRGPTNPICFGRLCITTGGVPRMIHPSNAFVVGLRDTESLTTFQSRLKNTRRMLLVGNGGIATEIAHEVSGCQIVWAIKHETMSAPFLDSVAARFLLEARKLQQQLQPKQLPPTFEESNGSGGLTDVQIRRMRYVVDDGNDQGLITNNSHRHMKLVPVDSKRNRPSTTGAALGPDWAHDRDLRGGLDKLLSDNLKIVYNVQVRRFLTPEEFQSENLEQTNPFPLDDSPITDWPVYVQLTNQEVYGCDLIVSAVGVEANFRPYRSRTVTTETKLVSSSDTFFKTAFDFAPVDLGGGLMVDEHMQTNVPKVYAAGDCAYANWTWAPHWFQMRLWNQARLMGYQAAKAMFGHTNGESYIPLDFSFVLFTHVTYFFGFKVVLLGLFNGQGLDLTSPDCYLLLRITPGIEYVKCVMQSGRMQGALLIGETDLEEVFEHLIVDQLDLTNLEDMLLDPNIDLTDYFD